MITDNSEQQAPERIRLVKRNGVFDGRWYYPDAAIMPFDTEIGYVRTALAAVEDGISWTALLTVLERLRSKSKNPEADWYNGWNAAIQCLINDINSRAAASSPLPAEELPFDDYCAGAGDCRACKGINCTCPHHAPAAEPESLYATCRRVWVCKRCGNCLDHCRHQDESNFHEDLAMPCSVKTPAEPPRLCLLCGHNGVSPDGTCLAPVPICGDEYHGTRCCGCKCRFAPAEPEGEQASPCPFEPGSENYWPATPPETPADAARAAAKEITRQFNLEKPGWVTVGRITIDRETETEKFERTTETATDRLTAIITRYLGATTPAARFVNAFEDAAKKAHIGFRHNAAWIACDWIECSERRAMVEQLRATTPLPSETAVGGKAWSSVDNWPVPSVLEHLAGAVEYLLRDHNCDAHGHETWKYAAEAARKHLTLLTAAPVHAAGDDEGPVADGRYCRHHDDDPAHGAICYDKIVYEGAR